MKKTIFILLLFCSCVLLLGGCKERSTDLLRTADPIANTVVDEDRLKTYGSLIGLSDPEVIAAVGEGVDEKGIPYTLSMDQENATEAGKVNLYLHIQRDNGARYENFGRYDK